MHIVRVRLLKQELWAGAGGAAIRVLIHPLADFEVGSLGLHGPSRGWASASSPRAPLCSSHSCLPCLVPPGTGANEILRALALEGPQPTPYFPQPCGWLPPCFRPGSVQRAFVATLSRLPWPLSLALLCPATDFVQGSEPSEHQLALRGHRPNYTHIPNRGKLQIKCIYVTFQVAGQWWVLKTVHFSFELSAVGFSTMGILPEGPGGWLDCPWVGGRRFRGRKILIC